MASIASEDASSPAEKPSAPPPPPPPEAAAETQPPSPEAVADASATPTSVSDAAPAPSTDAAPAPAPAPAAAAAAETPVGEGGTPTMTRDLSLSALDIPIPSVSSIGKKKGPTPPPTPPPEIVKEPAKHPPGVFSLFLSSETALSIGLDKDDAKHESLHSVSAQKVFDDIKNRGAASEFRPLKGQLQNYWEPNFTFRYITDDRYLNNDNFEIYATYDSREKLLADIAEAIAIKEELEGPRVWKNLGSDIEVDRECVKASRPPIQMRASRRRDEFYQKFTLKDRDALVRYVDALQQNEVMDLYEDDFATFADEDYQLGDKTTTAITVRLVSLELSMDIPDQKEYQSFSDITYGRSKMVSAVDWMPGRNGIVAAAISDSKSFDERMQIAGKPSDSYVLVWSFLDPIHPQMALESPSDVFSMRFNPVRPMLVAGGCYNGQVILWDLTTAQETVDRRHKRQLEDKSESSSKKTSEKAVLVLMSLLSSAKHSHSSIVSDIHWLPEDFQMSVKGQMVGNRGLTNFLASVSADGKVIFWDVTSKGEPELSPEWSDERRAAAMEGEKYKWNPVVEITLASLDPVKQVGPLKMAIHGLAAGGTQFYCSTEFGEILNADVTSPSGNNIKSIAVCHHGPVRALLASPFFKTVLLSIGIWTFALWKDNVKKVAMGNFFARQQAWVVDVKNRSKERERQIEKAQAQKEILKGREEQFFKLCTWTEEMEADYQKYENECRTKFGAKAA
ncbi:hypothetical protein AXG93_2018s1190 [Marchantia polymorpha subsp. ruderalis]|uniref:Uncharacterized protein n=1 Tax=Marchantia polymorpha subsp. ruderalis TaxID=1480154 RepID=A0A176WF27_MARPO|nr:hypothetical protein AXG93_2018s1190 [Marchantia polymorpha subsp. ruderalis]